MKFFPLRLIIAFGSFCSSGAVLADHPAFVNIELMPWMSLNQRLEQDESVVNSVTRENGVVSKLVKVSNPEHWKQLAISAHMASGRCSSMQALATAKFPLKEESLGLSLPSYSNYAYFDELEAWMSEIRADLLMQDIQLLTDLGSRFHASSAGLEAVETLYSELASIIANQSGWEISRVDHPWTQQNSIIVALKGMINPEKTTVIGAHFDSISPSTEVAPGADDNASGVASLLSLIRLLVNKQASFESSVEFHFYAAEEVGLVGSNHIAQSYRSQSREILAMMQIDMNFWRPKNSVPKVFLYTDYTSMELLRRAQSWLKLYSELDFDLAQLPSGAASDHVAWFRQGYPTIFAHESPLDGYPFIHTTEDLSEKLNNPELAESITRLALATIVYSSGLTILKTDYLQQQESLFESESEIKIAVYSSEDSYSIAVSTPPELISIEICEVTERLDNGCARERLTLRALGSKQGRNLFKLDSPLSLPKRFRIEAFNQQSERVQLRQVSLK